ncbi:septum formation initiator family protein [Streptomyces sp. NPDC049577]|uniref:FtsB family cell division protein n=1 Tax=Streptomyces sp. NPDC049577 TaxID=3155153 RepID=UPI003444FBC0
MTPARGRGPRLGRLLPTGAGARRTPFVLLVVVLLGSGLIWLLLLNSSLNQGSFELSRLQRRTTELTDQQQALQQEVDQLAAPDALERRARELGMIPGGSPAFLGLDGKVTGVPGPVPSAGAQPAALPAAPPAPVPAPGVVTPPVPGHDAEVPQAPPRAPAGQKVLPNAPLPSAGRTPAPPAAVPAAPPGAPSGR